MCIRAIARVESDARSTRARMDAKIVTRNPRSRSRYKAAMKTDESEMKAEEREEPDMADDSEMKIDESMMKAEKPDHFLPRSHYGAKSLSWDLVVPSCHQATVASGGCNST
jgi:hypothetical protein